MTNILKTGRFNTILLAAIFLSWWIESVVKVSRGNNWEWAWVIIGLLVVAGMVFDIRRFNKAIKESKEGDEWMRRFEEYESIPFDTTIK